jgi:NadR type nicotinamide-nucleotide adenylyltransferase
MATQLRPRSRDRGARSRVIKIVLTGSESTGKTELARALGEHFEAPVSTEFVRDFAEAHGGKIAFEDHGPIARGQIVAEDSAIALATALVILDTDLVSTVVYCEHYFGRCPPWIEQEARARAGHLYLLMKPDIPWTPDGVRDRGERRQEMHELFHQKLRELDLDYVEIGGDRSRRLSTAIRAIETVTRTQRRET